MSFFSRIFATRVNHSSQYAPRWMIELTSGAKQKSQYMNNHYSFLNGDKKSVRDVKSRSKKSNNSMAKKSNNELVSEMDSIKNHLEKLEAQVASITAHPFKTTDYFECFRYYKEPLCNCGSLGELRGISDLMSVKAFEALHCDEVMETLDHSDLELSLLPNSGDGNIYLVWWTK